MVYTEQYPFRISRPSFEIGAHTYFHSDLLLRTYDVGERIIIGKFCSIADQVVICSGGMRQTDRAALYPLVESIYRSTAHTTIGNDVWIGFGATILDGASVGDGAVIATRAVVFADVPPFAVVAGNPARVLRYRFSQPIVERLLRIAWWHWPMAKIYANLPWFSRPVADFVAHFDPQGGQSDDR
jgi:acetyltransferase-like isoleucine patch superfamily enzyme